MNLIAKYITLAAVLIASQAVCPAQNKSNSKNKAKAEKVAPAAKEQAAPAPVKLPQLPRSGEYTVGKLANGVEYFLIANPTSKGHADFALVQKGAPDKGPTHRALDRLTHFEPRVPYRFLSDYGIGYTDKGFVSFRPDATIFRFNDVPVNIVSVSDSTTLMMMDLAESHPSDQAIIVSGDITVAKFLDRMQVFSMIVSQRIKETVPDPYEWKSTDKPTVRFAENATANVASFSVRYSSPRLPKDQMNTSIPFVTRIFSQQLGIIATKRISREFEQKGIALAGVNFNYAGSADSGSDETYTFTVNTSESQLQDAIKAVAAILADLDANGATDLELRDAKACFGTESAMDARNSVVPNSTYVDKCIAAYMYGAELASRTTMHDYFSKRELAPEKELALFNQFVMAILDDNENIELSFDLPHRGSGKDGLLEVFQNGWKSAKDKDFDIATYRVALSDTLNLVKPDKKSKVKFKSTIAEPVTGGQLWTFSNGIKVIYKKTAAKRQFNYALLLKGGYADVDGLKPGENAFVADMMGLSNIAGMPGKDFNAMLKANGISMTTNASLSDLNFTGLAPSDRLELLLKSFLSMAKERTVDMKAFENYRKGESLRCERAALTNEGIDAVIDSLICPDYKYPDRKVMSSLQKDLPMRADDYFTRQFNKVNDGMLVLIGDLDEEGLKKVLCNYLGSFSVSDRISNRPRVEFDMRTGWSTYTVDSALSTFGDGGKCVNIGMTARQNLGLAKYVQARIASIAVEKSLVKALNDVGYSVNVNGTVRFFPVETIGLYVNCRPVDSDGLPESVKVVEPMRALSIVRQVLAKLAAKPMSAADLKMYKDELTNIMASQMVLPETLVEATIIRYSHNKDFISGYAEQIKAATAEQIRALLMELDNSAKVEYVFR